MSDTAADAEKMADALDSILSGKTDAIVRVHSDKAYDCLEFNQVTAALRRRMGNNLYLPLRPTQFPAKVVAVAETADYAAMMTKIFAAQFAYEKRGTCKLASCLANDLAAIRQKFSSAKDESIQRTMGHFFVRSPDEQVEALSLLREWFGGDVLIGREPRVIPCMYIVLYVTGFDEAAEFQVD